MPIKLHLSNSSVTGTSSTARLRNTSYQSICCGHGHCGVTLGSTNHLCLYPPRLKLFANLTYEPGIAASAAFKGTRAFLHRPLFLRYALNVRELIADVGSQPGTRILLPGLTSNWRLTLTSAIPSSSVIDELEWRRDSNSKCAVSARNITTKVDIADQFVSGRRSASRFINHTSPSGNGGTSP